MLGTTGGIACSGGTLCQVGILVGFFLNLRQSLSDGDAPTVRM